MPQARYFLNRIRRLQKRCEKYGPQKISKAETNDLILWKQYIHQASQIGSSLDLIAFTKIDTTIYTDASSHGMGEYNPISGMAWRIKLSPWMQQKLHINTVEFISATIGIWLEIIFNKEINYQCINCLTDNSSAVGWLFKANFDPNTQQKQDMVARHMARILLESETGLYTQDVPGEENIIADSLSREFHINDTNLQLLLTSLFPQRNRNISRY